MIVSIGRERKEGEGGVARALDSRKTCENWRSRQSDEAQVTLLSARRHGTHTPYTHSTVIV